MKKLLFLTLCLSTAIINAMDDDDDILSGEKQLQAISQAMPELETALEKWQIAVQQNPLSAITDEESAEKAVDSLYKPRQQARKQYKVVQPLAVIGLLTLHPESMLNKTVLTYLSSFDKLKSQLDAQETKFDEYWKLKCKMSKLNWTLDVLQERQERYAKTAKELQAHLAAKKTKESFFEEHHDDFSMIRKLDEFNMYSKCFTADTHQIKKDIDPYAFEKDWDEEYAKANAEYESERKSKK